MLPSIYWKKLSIGYRNLWVASILYGLEKLIETEFKCPEKKSYAVYYTLSFFIFPELLFSFITLYVLMPSCLRASHILCSRKILEVLAPFLIWITVLLIDGRYVECLFRTTKSTNAPSYTYSVSQMIGMATFFVLVSLYLIIQCCFFDSDPRTPPSSRI